MTDERNTFHIAFDTKSLPGKMVITKVRLETEIVSVSDPKTKERKFRVNLCDSPLFPRLKEYVANNPRSTIARD